VDLNRFKNNREKTRDLKRW